MPKKSKIKIGRQYREAQFDTSTINVEARTVELSFSSEEPYERYFGWEILGHQPEECRLARMNAGGAVCIDHNTRDLVGVVEKAWIGQDRKGRALARFGRSARAEEVFQDVIDGIRVNTSVSYDVHRMTLVKSENVDGGRDTVNTYRVTDWEPLEVSLVSVPADTTVGVGRDNAASERDITVEIPEPEHEEKRKMEKCQICGAELVNGACPACARAREAAQRDAQAAEARAAARINDILAMARKHDLMEDAQRYIAEGKSVQEFKDLVIEKLTVAPGEFADTARIQGVDQPIYRGSAACQLGQQLTDIRTLSAPAGKVKRSEIDAAQRRIEQTEKRHITKMEEAAIRENRAAATGGFTIATPSDGRYFLQGETVVDLMTAGFNNSEVLPRCAKRTLTATQFVEIYGIDETSRADGSRGGGVRVYTTAELDSLTVSKTKFNKIKIEPKKLTGLFYASGEWFKNVTFLGQEVKDLFGQEFAFKCQDLVINGPGAGAALGILNADCLVPVAKETGQAADTINTKNLSKMWARFRGRNPVWLINQDCGPQLDELSIVAGTAALEPRFVTYDAQGIMRIKGAPVIAIEQCPTLGDLGDIILGDFSQYVCCDQGDVEEAMSIHVNFIYDQDTYRFIYYFDGQPRWSSAVTPYKGSGTVSPFVALAARA